MNRVADDISLDFLSRVLVDIQVEGRGAAVSAQEVTHKEGRGLDRNSEAIRLEQFVRLTWLATSMTGLVQVQFWSEGCVRRWRKNSRAGLPLAGPRRHPGRGAGRDASRAVSARGGAQEEGQGVTGDATVRYEPIVRLIRLDISKRVVKQVSHLLTVPRE
jgi:hypothetical protein